MRQRKTIDVDTVKEVCNRALAQPTPSADERKAVSFVLETVLHRTGNYRGFRYTDGNNGETDETKRVYA